MVQRCQKGSKDPCPPCPPRSTPHHRHSIAMIEDAANRYQKVWRLPRFVTLVARPDQEVTHHFSWVHVSSVPLVHDNIYTCATEITK